MTAIKSIEIENLQRLNNITVNFEESGVTAIMGANGSGKTTLLQALACIYRRDTSINILQKNYRYNDFFIPYDQNDWINSTYNAEFYKREGKTTYTKASGNWLPKTQNRTSRYVKYISITDCAPDQEKESSLEIPDYERDTLGLRPAKKSTLLTKVSAALHKQYINAEVGKKNKGLKNFLIAKTRNPDNSETEYSSHFMGSGEQKVIYLINEILKAPKGSLILIEELDISLHDSATHSLVNFLLEQTSSPDRRLQIVFTTHWLGIQEFAKKLNIVSLYEEPESKKIVVHDCFDPQYIHSINGDLNGLRQIKVWVEDQLATSIVTYIARDCGVMQFIETKIFGSVQNAYTVAGTTSLSGEKLDRTIVLTDGDTYTTPQEKDNQIGKSIDGNGAQANLWRQVALNLVVDLNSPNKVNPETFLLNTCQILIAQDRARPWLIADLRWINQQLPRLEPKEAIYERARHNGIEQKNYENMLIQEVSSTDEWKNYVAPFVTKLEQAAINIGVKPVQQAKQVAA